MSGSTDPAADPELERLLDDYGQAEYEWGAVAHTDAGMHGDLGHRKHAAMAASRALLLSHLDAAYVRRYMPGTSRPIAGRAANRLPPSPPGSYKAARGILPWRPGDELPEERIRRMRDGADAVMPEWIVRHDELMAQSELVDNQPFEPTSDIADYPYGEER